VIRGCLDNCGSLCQNAIGYICPIKGIPELNCKANKETHGFCHHATACLLCPQCLQEKFDEDQVKFCCDVQNRIFKITHNDWPSFLYPEDGYNPDVIDEKLLQSSFLVSVSCSIIFCISMANLSIVLSTLVHWTAHCHEGRKGKNPRQEVHHRYLRHDRGNASDDCICCSLGEPPFRFITSMFLIDLSRAVLSSIRRCHGLWRMDPFVPISSSRISWISLMTKSGPRKRWLGGPCR